MELKITVKIDGEEKLANYLESLIVDQVPSIEQLQQAVQEKVERLFYSFDGQRREIDINLHLDTKDLLNIDPMDYGTMIGIEKYARERGHVLSQWSETISEHIRGRRFITSCIHCGEEAIVGGGCWFTFGFCSGN